MVEIKRDTKETQIKCSLTLDGCGKFSIIQVLVFLTICLKL